MSEDDEYEQLVGRLVMRRARVMFPIRIDLQRLAGISKSTSSALPRAGRFIPDEQLEDELRRVRSGISNDRGALIHADRLVSIVSDESIRNTHSSLLAVDFDRRYTASEILAVRIAGDSGNSPIPLSHATIRSYIDRLAKLGVDLKDSRRHVFHLPLLDGTPIISIEQ